jgi:predicted 2-oxoglutarate/Fe(II)-dependent dioxygenase YbiX
MTALAIGDKSPAVFGATAAGRFYSLDAQAGRPAILVALGGQAEAAKALYARLQPAQGALLQAGVDLVPLAPTDAAFAMAFAASPEARDHIVYVAQAEGLERLAIDGAPGAVFIDRHGRIVGLKGLDASADLAAWAGELAPAIASDPPRSCSSPAPVLMIPNIAPPALCRALIAHFEASPHVPGVMAAYADGAGKAKLDEGQKRRRDFELTADCPLYGEVVQVLGARCAPEIKRAFQVDIVAADRILIARYDETGGYFTRHRDDAAPHVAFREFAVSLNLNTDEYEGGDLLFPEYSDDRYRPPAGAAAVFSASLLHEAQAVTRGQRYVLLTFLCSAAGQAKKAAMGA